MANVDISLFYLFVFFTAALILLLIAVVWSHIKTLRKYADLKKIYDDDLLDSKKKAQSLIDEASLKAENEIVQGRQKAQQIITDAQNLDENQKLLIKNQFEKIITAYSNNYANLLNSTKEEINKLYINISKDIVKITNDQLENNSKLIQEKMLKAIEEYKNLLAKLLDNAKIDLESYKKERISRIDSKISSTLNDVLFQILGKEISSKKHEELIKSALEKAIEENVL